MKLSRGSVAAFLLLSVCSTSQVQATPRWISLGPTCEVTSMDFAAAPNEHIGFVASAGRLFKTVDSGSSWTPRPVGQPNVRFVTIDKVDPDRVYVHSTSTPSTSDGSSSTSTDGGSSWSPGTTGWSFRFLFDASPTNASILFATDNSFAYRSTDAGLSFQRISPVTCASCRQRAEMHRATGRLWVSTRHLGANPLPWTLHYSDDDGDSWTAASTPGTIPPSHFGLATFLQDSSFIAYLGGSGYLGGTSLHFSEDAGQTWNTLAIPSVPRIASDLAVVGTPAGRTFFLGFAQTLGITPPEGPARGPLVFSSTDGVAWTQVDPLANHELSQLFELSGSLVARTGAGFYRSADKNSWNRSSDGINTGGAALSLAQSPSPDVVALYGCRDANSYVVPSRDGGRSFEEGVGGDPSWQVAISPHDENLWAYVGYDGPAASSVAFSLSDDAGRTWQWQPRFTPNLARLYFHPGSPGVLFAQDSSPTLYRSTDNGVSFSPFFVDPANQHLGNVLVTMDSPPTILVESRSSLWALDESGSLLSQQPSSPPGNSHVTAVVQHPQPLWFAARTLPWVSSDRGQTWTLAQGLPQSGKSQPVWDPHAKRLLIGTSDGLYSSEDGVNWDPTGDLSGLQVIDLQANRYGHIVAATRNQGVWVYNDPVFFGDFETGDLRHWSQP